MSQIEDLLREALHETPAPATMHDPLSAVEHRVRRARRRIAVGGGLGVAGLVAAVLVPLTLAGGTTRGGLQVAHSPSPTSAPSRVAGMTTLVARDVKSVVTDGSTSTSYVLVDYHVSSGAAYVAISADGKLTHQVTVQGPADYLVAGSDQVWVIGTDPATGHGRITAVEPSSGVTTTNDAPTGRILSATVAADSLFVVAATRQGTEVDRYVAGEGGMGLVGFQPIRHAARVVADGGGTPWVQTDTRLIELKPGAQLFSLGGSVSWDGRDPVLAPAPNRDLWAYDGRLIQLDPRLLHSGVSVAEGARLPVSARPTAVVPAGGGVYCAIPAYANHQSGVLFYRLSSGTGSVEALSTLSGVDAVGLALDPHHGVDVVTATGSLARWTPVSR